MSDDNSIEGKYRAKLKNRDATRSATQGLMNIIWAELEPTSNDMTRRILTSLITEIQTALKED